VARQILKTEFFSTVHYQKLYSLLLSFCFVIGTTTKYEMITLYVRYLPFFMFSLLVVYYHIFIIATLHKLLVYSIHNIGS
jgi:hypothetical protein